VFHEKLRRPRLLFDPCTGDRGRRMTAPVTIVRKATDRLHDRNARQERWSTFDPQNPADPLGDGFGDLEMLKEVRLAPRAGVPRTGGQEAELLTYVYEGALAYEDSLGHSGVVQAGEFQRVTVGRGLRHTKQNASRAGWAHFFQLWLHPSEAELEPEHVQTRFTAAERRDWLCIVASPDARRGSLRIHQDVLVYSALLDPGQHMVHELSPGRGAWLHVVHGEVTHRGLVLTAGDGAGFAGERAVSFTAVAASEVLLVNLDERTSKPVSDSGSSPGRGKSRLPRPSF
jgi:redox-sensitive bicupin YhaK (pirin superfamily)